jgi:hypothetical protein
MFDRAVPSSTVPFQPHSPVPDGLVRDHQQPHLSGRDWLHRYATCEPESRIDGALPLRENRRVTSEANRRSEKCHRYCPATSKQTKMRKIIRLVLPSIPPGRESFCAQPYNPLCYQIGSAPPVASVGNRGNPIPITPVAGASASAASDNPHDQSVRLFNQVQAMSRRLDQLGQRSRPVSAPMSGQHHAPLMATTFGELATFPNYSGL